MKKLYFLNEEEKERILRLHESATKKQYLFEDMDNSMCEGCEKTDMYETELDEADAGAVVTGLMLGGVAGAALAYANSSSGSYTGVKKIFDACSQSGMGKSTMDGGTMDSIASKVRTAVSGLGTDEDAIKDALSQIQTLPDLCDVIRRYSQNYPGSTLIGDLDGDIDSDSEWNEYVYLPLLAAKRKSEELGNKSGGGSGGGWFGGILDAMKQKVNKITSDKEWYKYPCIPTNPQAKPSQMSNGSTVFIIGQEVFYNNGRKKKADGTMGNYVCPSSGGGNVAPKTTTTVTKKSTGTGTGTGVVAQSNVKQVQKLVGVAETGVFDTATAKAVRTKLGA